MGILVLNSKQSEAMKQLGHDEELWLNGLAGSDPLNANKFSPLSLKPAPGSFHETILQAAMPDHFHLFQKYDLAKNVPNIENVCLFFDLIDDNATKKE
jgi:hypothetical protein